MATAGQVADEQAAGLAGRRAGQQIPVARLLPGRLGIDRLVGGLCVDGYAVGGIGQHEQFRSLVAVEVVRHRIDRHLVDRNLAVRPLRRQRQFVGPLGVAGIDAGAVGPGQPTVEVEAGLPRIDHHDVVPAVVAEVGDKHPFAAALKRNHPHALPAVEWLLGSRERDRRGDD